MTSLLTCPPEMLLHNTALLNERGASLLLAGQDKSAVAVLTESLMIVKQLLNQEEEEVPPSSSSSSTSHFKTRRSSSSSSSSSSKILQPSTDVLSNLNHPQIQSFVYDRVVTFNSSTNSFSCNSSTIKIHAASVVFNLALAHHRRANVVALAGNLPNSLLCMEKAKQLYGMVLKLLPDGFCVVNLDNTTNNNNDKMNTTEDGDDNINIDDDETCCDYTDMARLVRLAALNNLCQILFEQGLYEEAQGALGEMVTLIYQAEDEASSSWSFRTLFQANEWDGFLLNVLLMTRPNVAAAA